jgi:hypothetical protein
MKYRIWYSTESFADYIIANTALRNKTHEKRKLYESDANNANNFHSLPDHIKQILYLDAPDLIVELDTEPIFSIEVTTEAGTGHNAFLSFVYRDYTSSVYQTCAATAPARNKNRTRTAKSTPYLSCHRDNFLAKVPGPVAGWLRQVTQPPFIAGPL